METKRIWIDPEKPSRSMLAEAASIIRRGGLVAFPTETVYGLGANALDSAACHEIYVVKGRPQDNPLIVHISNLEMADQLVASWPEKAERCARAFWPGPLTMVLPKSELIPASVTGELDTVAIRMPKHEIALALIAEAGVPIAAPSANLSGKPSPTTADHVWADLEGMIPLLIDGGSCEVGLESTVLDLSGDVPLVLRPGGVTREQLEGILGEEVFIDVPNQEAHPKAPGMKYRHYAPEAEMLLIRGEDAKVLDKMLSFLAEAQDQKRRVGVFCTAENEARFKAEHPDFLFNMGDRHKPYEIASRIFKGLRLADELGIQLILAEGLDEGGIGLAIMNRLEKAAGHKIIYAT